MKETCRGSRRRQCSRHLCSNNADLSHAGRNDFSFALSQHLHSAEKIIIQWNCPNRFGFNLKDSASTNEIEGWSGWKCIFCHIFQVFKKAKNQGELSVFQFYFLSLSSQT